ncbi:MAG: LamG-like jellyroll fold domain-containing protein [Alphaproteobacteria bacterium]
MFHRLSVMKNNNRHCEERQRRGNPVSWEKPMDCFVILFLAMTLILVFSAPAFAACANPVGAAGDMTYNNTDYVMQWCDGTNWNGVGKPLYIPNAVNFDGTNDWLNIAGALTGVTDTKLVTGSFWIKRYETADQFSVIHLNAGGGEERFRVFIDSSDRMLILAEQADPTRELSSQLATVFNDTGKWHHVMFSFDMSDTGKRYVYVDGVADATTYFNYVDATINASGSTDIRIGGNSTQKSNTDFADFWLDFGTYLDLSDVNIRRQFIDANGFPVNLGTDGSRPTGSPPDIFLSGATASWHTNKGTGGGFTENGALTDAITDPGDNFGPTGNLVGWWKLDETSGTTAADSSGNGNNGTMQNGQDATNDSAAGIINNALDFDGVNDGVFIGSPAAVDEVFNDGGTIAAWVYYDSFPVSGHRIMDKAGSFGWHLAAGGGTIGFGRRFTGVDGDWSSSSAVINLGTWHHVALTYNDNATTNDPIMYVDGVSVGVTEVNTPTGSANVDTSDNLIIGNRTGYARPFDGRIDDVRLYKRILSAAEIQELYDTGYPCKNPTAHRDGDMTYNTTHHVPQYCNLREWKAMAPSAGDGGAGCTNPVGAEGDVVYNSISNVMQYCEGDTWRAMGVYN